VSRTPPTAADMLSFVDSEDLFHAHTMQATGLTDFGDPSYREGMRVALKAFDTEAKLHDAGRAAARTAPRAK
jgi:hypothetical protein